MPRLQIAYVRNLRHDISYGRSGHILKDLFTSVILGTLLNLEIVCLRSEWNQQKLIKGIDFGKIDPNFRCRKLYGGRKWGGISFERFESFANEVQACSEDTVFILKNEFRVHLAQLHVWELESKIPAGSMAKCLAELRRMYWQGRDNNVRNGSVAIHARRGDVANPRHPQYNKMGTGAWPADYYQTVVDRMKCRGAVDNITIYSEKWNSHDLRMIEGAELVLGGAKNLANHFHRMVTSEFFVPCNSSVSTWASYLSIGRVLIPEGRIKHFQHPEMLENWESL